jgi:dimethylargininase
MVDGITISRLGKPDHELALIQHAAYTEALKKCGLDVLVLDPDERFPDSTFVEDTALLTANCAIIARPGALSRQGETEEIKQVLEGYYRNIEEVQEPGTVEGGDIMMVGSDFYIGLSERTNLRGAHQVISFLEKYDLKGFMIPVGEMLHFKTGIAYLEQKTIIATSDYLQLKEFQEFKILEVNKDESYAANCIWVNGKVLVAKGYPKVIKMISDAGYSVIELDMSEFRKIDGGLSCLSLRF